MIALIVTALADPTLRAAIKDLLKELFEEELPKIRAEGFALAMDLIHRRSADPDFAAKSDAAMTAYTQAQTSEEKLNALRTISALASS